MPKGDRFQLIKIQIKGYDDPWVAWDSIGYFPLMQVAIDVARQVRARADRRMCLVNPPSELGVNKQEICKWLLENFAGSDDPYFIWGIILDHEEKRAV